MPGLDAVLVVSRYYKARNCGLNGMLAQIEWLEAEAARWPHSQRLAYHLLRCHGLLVRNPFLSDTWDAMRPAWFQRYQYWADRVVRISPHSAEMARARAEAMFQRAMNDPDCPRLETVLEVRAEHERAYRLSPLTPLYGHDYAWALRESARLLRETGRADEAADCEARAETVQRETKDLEQRRWGYGLS
jgi:hypothetical protein